jgi:hypothetical protein
MKATELRIGNWVDQPNEGVAKVTSILNNLQIRTETGYVDKYCKPIPLTEEWLLKFGFKWKNFAFRDGTFTVRYQKEFYVYLSVEGVRPIQIKLDYVHQLQNLYFALTGEELDIK